jgi:CheY-like chemotaxis protein
MRLVPKHLRLLVVDDSMTARRIIAMRLQALSAPGTLELEVEEAEDGESALARYKQARPDLVLLDLTMPGIGGYQTLRDLIALDPAARVVIVSADIQDEARTRALEAGACGFLAKPISAAQLGEILRRSCLG